MQRNANITLMPHKETNELYTFNEERKEYSALVMQESRSLLPSGKVGVDKRAKFISGATTADLDFVKDNLDMYHIQRVKSFKPFFYHKSGDRAGMAQLPVNIVGTDDLMLVDGKAVYYNNVMVPIVNDDRTEYWVTNDDVTGNETNETADETASEDVAKSVPDGAVPSAI